LLLPEIPDEKLYSHIFFFKTYKIWGWKFPIVVEFGDRSEILSIHISSIRNLHLSVGKLQLTAPPTFSTNEPLISKMFDIKLDAVIFCNCHYFNNKNNKNTKLVLKQVQPLLNTL